MISSPLSVWLELWESSAKAFGVGFRFAEMAQAAGEVIRSRSETIGSAVRDPLNGDYRELGRMVPEKLIAFNRAGGSIIDDLNAIQANAQANWSHGVSLMLSGRPPSAADAAAMWTRSSAVLSRSVSMAGKAMDPVHRTATGNARRLRRNNAR